MLGSQNAQQSLLIKAPELAARLGIDRAWVLQRFDNWGFDSHTLQL